MSAVADRGSVLFADLPAEERARVIERLLGPPTTQKYSSDEMARLGPAMFSRSVRPNLTALDDGKFVIVDLDTGEYVLADDLSSAVGQFSALRPGVVGWLQRVGYVAVFRHGGRPGGWRRA